MSRIEYHEIAGFRCDKPGCPAVFDQPRQSFFAGFIAQQKAAAAAGWSFWPGRRTSREYCPEHGPSSRSSMTPL